MSDPLEDRFRDFATGTPAVNPAGPAEIRDRGDRMRHRRTALTAAGAALAVVLIATPVAVLATGGDGRDEPAPAPSPTATDSSTVSEPSSAAALPDTVLPEAGDLPTRDRLTPWEQVETTDERLVGCQPDVGLGADELIQQSFIARIAGSDGLPAGEDVAAVVRVSVLQYGSEADAEAAEAAVTGWIRDCDDPAGFDREGATRQGGLVDTEAGTYATWVYAAPEICTDCDAAWFERMSVLADQGRMVVVSFREVGGPLEPEGLDATMRDLMLQAAGRSMPG